MRFGFFFFAEYVNVFILSALTVTLFFGGWNAPIDGNRILRWLNVAPPNGSIDLASLGIGLLFLISLGPPILIVLLALPFWMPRATGRSSSRSSSGSCCSTCW